MQKHRLEVGSTDGQITTREPLHHDVHATTSSSQCLAGIGSLVYGLSQFPSLYSAVGSIAGITHRVGQLLEALEELVVCAFISFSMEPHKYCSAVTAVPTHK